MARRKILLTAGMMVIVEWEDIQDLQNEDWNANFNSVTTASVQTIGWVATDYRRGERTFLLARDYTCDEEGGNTYRSVMAMPAGCITGIHVLETGAEVWDKR